MDDCCKSWIQYTDDAHESKHQDLEVENQTLRAENQRLKAENHARKVINLDLEAKLKKVEGDAGILLGFLDEYRKDMARRNYLSGSYTLGNLGEPVFGNQGSFIGRQTVLGNRKGSAG